MVMPLDLFLTDPTVVSRLPTSRTGYKELGEFGQEMSQRAYRDKVFGEEKRQFDTEQGRRSKADASVAAYHTDLVDARREASRNALEGKREARVTALLAQMRKSANANKWDEVESIRAELTRMGYATEESDTEFTPPAEAAEAIADAGMPKPPAPKVPAAKGPKPDPAFLGTLSQLVANEKPGEGTIEAGDPLASPFPWEASGMPAPPKKKGPGGRFTIKDPQGNLVQTMDVPMEMEKDRGAIESALSSFIDDPANPESQGAARRASQVAQRAIATGMAPDKALQLGLQSYKAEMQRYKTQRLPSAQLKGGGGGVSRQEQSKQLAMTDDTKDIIFKIDDRAKLPAAREAMGAMSNMDMALDKASEEGFAGGAAISGYLKAISGAQVSDREADRIFGGAGKQAFWENEINKYIDGGKLPPDLIRGLRGVASRAREVFKARSDEAAMKAEGMIDALSTMATPEQKAAQKRAARGYFTGDFGGGGGAKPGAPASDDAERQDLLKKLEKYR